MIQENEVIEFIESLKKQKYKITQNDPRIIDKWKISLKDFKWIGIRKYQNSKDTYCITVFPHDRASGMIDSLEELQQTVSQFLKAWGEKEGK